jgi:hypothetical protein
MELRKKWWKYAALNGYEIILLTYEQRYKNKISDYFV